MPIYALGTEIGMGDGLPGFDGKAFGGDPSELYFEGSFGDAGKRSVFGTSFKAGTSRASGGPW
eukprot:1500716-Prymnesium_polylepis.1